MPMKLSFGVYGALVFDRENPPPSLGEYNFVFGHNGSGKTSLADAAQEWGAANSLEIARFDRVFVLKVLAQTDAVEGLWVVAPEAKELVETRDEMRARLTSLADKSKTLRSAGDEARASHEAFVKPLATELRELKRKAYDSASTYSTGHLADRLDKVAAARSEVTSSRPADLRRRIEQPSLRSIDSSRLDTTVSLIEDMLSAFEQLSPPRAHRAQRANWTKRSPETDHKPGDQCPYCHQPLSESVIEKIAEDRAQEEDSEFETVISVLDRIRVGGLDDIWPDASDFEASLAEDAKRCISSIEAAQGPLRAEVPLEGRIASALTSHAESPDDPSWLSRIRTLMSDIERLQELIREHNGAVKSQVEARRDAFNDYETVRLTEVMRQYRNLVANREKVTEELASCEAEIIAAQRQLSDIEREIKGLLDPQVLNEDLARYLGHRAIRFETQEGDDGEQGYQVVRADGRRAHRLSEGENTAVALLYFLRGLREAESPVDVVVIDDPVTSLDDSGVFTAHSFIKDAVARAHGEVGPTVMITSHNHAYFRLLAEWSLSLNRDGRQRSELFETVAYVDGDNNAICRVRGMPPGIAHAGSEYSILMSRLVEYSSEKVDSEDAYEMYIAPNVARRILEGFLTFKFGGPRRAMIGDLLVLAFNDQRLSDFGAERRERLHKLLNSSSHGSGLADTYTAISSRTEVAIVVKDVLELIRLVDADHLRGFED